MKKIFLAFALAACAFEAAGQTKDHIPGGSGVRVAGGIGDRVIVVDIGYHRWFARKFFAQAIGYYSALMPGVEDREGYRLTGGGMDVSGHYTVFNIKGMVFFNLFLGVGFEFSEGHIVGDDGPARSESATKFTTLGGAEMEVRAFKGAFIFLSGDAHYGVGEKFGSWRPYGKLGVRVTL